MHGRITVFLAMTAVALLGAFTAPAAAQTVAESDPQEYAAFNSQASDVSELRLEYLAAQNQAGVSFSFFQTEDTNAPPPSGVPQARLYLDSDFDGDADFLVR